MKKSKYFYNIKGFISSNVDNIYKRTESYDVEKYVVLLIQIAKLRLKNKCSTKIDWKTKNIKIVKDSLLNENQLGAMEWVLNNRLKVYEYVSEIIDNFIMKRND